MRSTFGKSPPEKEKQENKSTESNAETKPTKQYKKEKVVVWVKKTEAGDEFLSIKINDVDGKTLNFRAYKKKNKASEGMPDFVGLEK